MNWALGLIGALFGAAIASEHGVFGALVGFLLVYLLVTVGGLKTRLQRNETDLGVLRLRVAELASPATTPASTAVAGVQGDLPDVAERAGSGLPKPETSSDDGQAAAQRAHWAERMAALAAQKHASADAASSSPLPPLFPDSAQPSSAATSTQAQVRRPHPIVRAPAEPGWNERLTAAIKRWFTEGNVPVKIGVLVLFVGVAAALRYAAAQGYFTMPIEVRLALIAAGGLAALVFGWREREQRPAFGLSLQGGALGVLLLTIFAAYGKYHLMPPMAAFALVVVLTAGAALLAVLQDAIALAALGFLGGYLAPVLISTGNNNPVGLFTYYAVLNAAVFAVSWTRSWRLLNLIGFGFTFGVGTAWGTKFYRPELFATIEPFLILFFVFYVVIGLLYVIRQTEHRKPWVDGTLVFGTPLLAFPLQAALLKDDADHMALAFSALVVALVYAGLVFWLRRNRDERLLTEAYGALALGFATLAVPLAFSAGTTSSVWALEGAGIAWLGIRQDRKFPWLSGLALQLLAAGAYVLGQIDFHAHTTPQLLLLNPAWLGAAIIAFAGYALSLIHDRKRPVAALPLLLFVWASFWWLVAALTQLDLADRLGIGTWRFGMGTLAATIGLAAILRARLPWSRLGWLIAGCALLALFMTFGFDPQVGGPLAPERLPVWSAYIIAIGWALWNTRDDSSRLPAATHLFWLWTIAAAMMLQSDQVASTGQLANGWHFAALFAPLALLTLGLWRRSGTLAWPRALLFDGYRIGWFAPASALLAFAFVAGLFVEGSTSPLAYVPLLNPLELMLLAIAVLLYALCPESLQGLRKVWPYAGFALVTSATLRAVHHWHGEPWSADVFDSGVSQMALTLVWSLLGVGSWIAGSKRGDRRLWMGGAVLMGVVLVKLIALDRHYMGDMHGIASFLAVGLLLVGVGYIAPTPPKQDDAVNNEQVGSK